MIGSNIASLYRNRIAISALTALIAVFGLFAYIFLSDFLHPSQEERARRITSLCEGAASRAACYEEEVPRLLDKGVTLEEAFSLAYEIQKIDQTGEYCHGIGHKLGSVEVAKNPSAWKEIARRAPMGACLSGGLHGAFQERFRNDSLAENDVPQFLKEMEGFCDEDPMLPSNPTDLTMCAHGVGHLSLFLSQGDIGRSLALCDSIHFGAGGGVTENSQKMSCYDGAFMQLFEPREAEDYALIQGESQTVDSVGGFCSQFREDAKATCIARSATLFYSQAPSRSPLSCEVLATEMRRRSCKAVQARLFGRDTFFEPRAAEAYCAAYAQKDRGSCFANIGSYALMSGFDSKQPFTLCAYASSLGFGEACFATLSHFIADSFSRGSEERGVFCMQLPEPYRASCSD